MGNEKIDHVDSFTYLGSIISKDSGSSEYVSLEYPRLRAFFTVKKV